MFVKFASAEVVFCILHQESFSIILIMWNTNVLREKKGDLSHFRPQTVPGQALCHTPAFHSSNVSRTGVPSI